MRKPFIHFCASVSMTSDGSDGERTRGHVVAFPAEVLQVCIFSPVPHKKSQPTSTFHSTD